jgi:predicted Zn-dependent protease
MLGLGSTLRALGRDAESDEVLREAIERFPDFRAFRIFRAMTLYNLGEAREAVRELIHLLLESTSDASILRYRRALSGYADDLDRSWLEENG